MREALKQSIDNLRTNKLRSFLTMFGIMWGVISIVMLSAMGEGFQRGNQAVLEELGKNIVIMRNGRTSTQAGGERAGRVIRLTIADAHALKSNSRVIQEVSPELMRGGVSVKSALQRGIAADERHLAGVSGDPRDRGVGRPADQRCRQRRGAGASW